MAGLKSFKLYSVLTLLSGIFLIVAWILFISGYFERDYSSAHYYIPIYIEYFGTILFLFALIGLYLYHLNSSGKFLTFSFIIGVTGTTLSLGAKYLGLYINPYINKVAPDVLSAPPESIVGLLVSFLVYAIGVILIGINIMKLKKLPFLGGLVLAVSPFFEFVPVAGIPLSYLILGLALFYLGVSLYRRDTAVSLS
ncbi:hypothetical protein KHA93_16390 [Bacillus sp. FJAT-49732]|uniref:Uncharacterized protein n=1 Tax=Lederbergia citrisecunda TaxID=2833583 RepID=A0A942TPW0_9BACI|nr:hypothetical protein [Lederbergia citrisecunda]MBS4201218.1 hypothetical protein [Lederbergia citrisecunda]